MIRIGVECEQLEQNRFGIGQTLARLLDAIAKVPGIEKKFRFVLYFKSGLPDDAFLHHPAFEKKVLMPDRKFFVISYNLFYHILLPLRYWIDAIDVFLFPSNMLPAFFIGKALVVLVNDVYFEAHHGTIPLRYRISYLLFCWWAAKRARIMTISEFSKNELKQFYHIPDARIFVNPWSIDPIFHALSRTVAYTMKMQELKKKFGIQNDFILSIGQAFPRRHVKETMEAFGRIAVRYPRMQYLVACADKYNPPLLGELAKRVNAKEKRRAIIFTDYLAREDLPYLINEAKALSYLSSREAFGLPPFEAVSCGTPAIVADTPTTREFFGKEGFFVGTPSDPDQIAVQLREVLDNEAKARTIAKIQAARIQKFTWQAHIEKLFSVLQDMTNKAEK